MKQDNAGNVLAQEAEIAARRARDAAKIVEGIPIYMSLFFTLDLIARDLERAVERYKTAVSPMLKRVNNASI